MGTPLLEVNGVWKRLCRRPDRALRYAFADIGREIVGIPPTRGLREGEFWALEDVNLSVEPGQVVGVIGHNGAGKSTLINLVSGMTLPTLGSITLRTPRVVLVDHSGGLNPIETGRENALTHLALHGVPEAKLAEELGEVEAFADIPRFLDAPVGTYSLGMRLRLAFAIYSRLRPDLLVIDEALGGGDERFRNKFRTSLRDYVDGGGAMLLCSHEMLVIQAFCDRCLVLDGGREVMSGPAVMAVARYQEIVRDREAEQARDRAERASREIAGRAAGPTCSVQAITIEADDAGAVRPGVPVTIEIAVAVTEDIDGVACGVEIGRGDLTSLATLIGGYPNACFALRPPVTRLRCRIDRLPLAPGTYDIRVALSLPESATTLATVGYRDPSARFVVVSVVDEISNLTGERSNILHIPTEWSVAAPVPVRAAEESA